MPFTSERSKVAHLLRRSGFGASAAEIDAAMGMGLAAATDAVLNPERLPDDTEALVTRADFDFTKNGDAIRWWTLRMIRTRRPFEEKMTLFWHGLLTSALTKTGGRPEYMVQQIDTYRRMALGGFRDLVVAAAKDPAMIRWLDSDQNRKGKPNENFARELMELFTLGIGAYSEADVREGARAFTGWFQKDGQFAYNAGQHDNGAKTVLGMTGAWNGEDVIDILVRQPACHRFIARKLWTFFAYPDPEDGVVNDIAAAFSTSSYDIRATMRALFTHPAFYSDRAYHGTVKSPLEFAAGFARTLEAKTDGVPVFNALAGMGQIPMNPPNVAGWPGGAAWISTNSLISRYNLVTNLLRFAADQPTFIDVSGIVAAKGLKSKEQILGYFADLLVDGDLSAKKLKVLDDYLVAKDDGKPGAFTLDEKTITNKVRGLIYLLAATPEYQMN